MLSISQETTCSYEIKCSVMHSLNHLHALCSGWLRSAEHNGLCSLSRGERRGEERRCTRPGRRSPSCRAPWLKVLGVTWGRGCFASRAFSLRHSLCSWGSVFADCPRSALLCRRCRPFSLERQNRSAVRAARAKSRHCSCTPAAAAARSRCCQLCCREVRFGFEESCPALPLDLLVCLLWLTKISSLCSESGAGEVLLDF